MNMLKISRVLLLLPFCLHVQNIYAEGDDIEVEVGEKCSNLKRTIEIAKCINEVREAHGLEPEMDVFGEWIVVVEIDPMTDQSNVIITTDTEVREDKVGMSLRCLRGKQDLIVKWPFGMNFPARNEPVEIRSRIDTEKPVTSTWRMAKETHNAMFYEQDIDGIVDALIASERFVIEQASGVGSNVAVFATSGFDAAIQSFQDACT